jgi:hypothetical protein
MSFVYIAEDRNGLLKIGCSTQVEDRLAVLSKTYGPMRLLFLTRGDYKLESAMHRSFDKYRVGVGTSIEWFKRDGKLADFLERNTQTTTHLLYALEQYQFDQQIQQEFLMALHHKVRQPEHRGLGVNDLG